MKDILKRVSAYLDKLAGQVFDLEETIGHAVREGKASDPQTITKLQTLDFLRQSLEDLALMTLLLGSSEKAKLASGDLQKVGEKLKLQATQTLLDGYQHHSFGEKSDAFGDLDLF
ncbi:hypothetical protein [uncultured Roseobacter sp.]|uniref:hypothetical protein n=1 Tax=uncultured Roseobacter sp. TaxID=114847 RepID=UPI002635A47B|nr:hypothetical protein [uncultured Roseobacter sp.]